jgi:osmotically-inducible protein OsmY
VACRSSRRHAARGLAWGAALTLLSGLCACGEPSIEEKLSNAEALLVDARAAVQEAQGQVEETQESLEQAQSEVEAARQELRDAESRLAEVESTVDFRVTDALLFRAIQKRLLEADELADLAIRAEVVRGAVTLHGSVRRPEARDTAIEIAKGVPGVATVDSRIEVLEESGAAP